MATIIDSLVVLLGLDTKGFNKSSKDSQAALDKTGKQANKTQKDLADAGKAGAEAMAKFRNELIRAAAAFVGLESVKSFVSSVTRSDAALGRMSRNVGVSTQTLSAWEGMADRAGGSAQSMANDMKNVVGQMMRMNTTGEVAGIIPFFASVGVSLVDTKDKLRDMDKVLLDVADRFEGMDPKQAQSLGAGMGLSEDTVNVLLQGRKAMQAFLAEEAKFNTRTPEDTKNAAARTNSWLLMISAFNRLATTVLNTVTPALVGLTDFIRNNAGAATVAVGSLAAAMTILSLIRFGGVLGSLASLAGGLGGAVGAVGLGIGGGLLAGLAALTAAIVGLVVVSKALSPDDKSDTAGHPGQHWVPGTGRSGSNGSWERDDGRSNNHGVADPAAVARGQAAFADKESLLSMLEQKNGLPKGMLDSMWFGESRRGANKGTSPAGARGDFQFMPDTAKRYGLTDLDDFGQSAAAAAHMMSDLLKKYRGNVSMALAGYDWGEGNVDRKGLASAPNETQNYVRDNLGRMGLSAPAMTSNSNSNETHIGQIVLPQVKDATSFARSLPEAMRNQSLALQSNSSLTQ